MTIRVDLCRCCFFFQQNNRENLVIKNNKLNDSNKGKYENPKKSTDTQLNNNATQSTNKNVIINDNQLKNDTYESVCSPDDTAQRTKMAQRHLIAVNNTISTKTVHIDSNSSMPSIAKCSSNNNNNRILKRVISAPVTSNETKGNYLPFFLPLSSLFQPLHLQLRSERQH